MFALSFVAPNFLHELVEWALHGPLFCVVHFLFCYCHLHHQFFFLSRAALCTLEPLVSSSGSKTQKLICGLISPGIFPKLAYYEVVIEFHGKLQEHHMFCFAPICMLEFLPPLSVERIGCTKQKDNGLFRSGLHSLPTSGLAS